MKFVQAKEEAGSLEQEGQGPGPQGAGGVEEGREEAGDSRGGQVESSRALRVGAIGVSPSACCCVHRSGYPEWR